MAGCNHCGSGCSNCSKSIELSEAELEILALLGQYAFLPICRKQDSETPLCVFNCSQCPETASLALLCLEKKGLALLDYDMPLKGFCDSRYFAHPLRGSAALTARGQQVLDLLEVHGIE